MNSALLKAGLTAGLFFPLFAAATTFGPIPVVEQAENSQYYVQGKVTGSPWVEMEPRLNRPYTYWRVSVSDQPLGEGLPSEIIIRQPGGEIGEMGYQVAGSAEFSPGEEVIVALHDTDQNAGTKEVVGLASGKYRIEKGPNGEPIMMSGLGLPVTGADGQPLGPDAFKALLRRVAKKETSDADRSVFVTRKAVHENGEDHAESAERMAEAAKLRGLTTGASLQTLPQGQNSPGTDSVSNENRVQKRAPSSEEPSTGSSVLLWIFAALAALGLIAGLAFALRR